MNRNNYYISNQQEEDGNDYDDDEDDEGDYDDEDDLEINPQLTNLSADLKRLLGLPVEDNPTDWTPPARSGLDNSNPIVATAANVSSPTKVTGNAIGRVQSIPTQPMVIESKFQPQAPPSAQRPSNGRPGTTASTSTAIPTIASRPTTQPQMKGTGNREESSVNRLMSLSAEIRSTVGVLGVSNTGEVRDFSQTKTYSYSLSNGEEEDDDDEEDLFDGLSRGSLESIPMSAELRRILGLPLEVKNPGTTNVSDWKPPQTWGLVNSEPIIKTAKNDPPVKQNAPVINIAYTPSAERKTSDDEEDDDEEDEDYERDLDDIPMSADLRMLLGLAPMAETAVTDWKPPSKSGLDNSDPILKKNGYSKAEEDEEEGDNDEEDDDEEENDRPLESVAMSEDLRRLLGLSAMNGASQVQAPSSSNWKAPTSHGLANSEPIIRTTTNTAPIVTKFSLVPTYGNDEDEDEDDEDEEDDDVDDSTLPNDIAMSDNLKRILGLLPADSAPTVQTDWKPPSRSGLDNSDPIVATKMNARR